MTVARDEAEMLPRWVGYYAGQVGMANLIVMDDNSVDGSTDGLPCTVLRLPSQPWKVDFEHTRMKLASGIGAALLSCYDVIIFCDVDEFLVPDPSRHRSLLDYLRARSDREVIAPVGMNLLHNTALEPPLDPGKPVLAQRRFVKFAPGMCKPAVKRVSAPWRAASHGILSPFEVDPDLWMLHLKFYDLDALRRVADHRNRMHQLDGRADNTTWTRTGSELADELLSWTSPVAGTDHGDDGAHVPDFDPTEVDLEAAVKKMNAGLYRASGGGHIYAMTNNPLRTLPERFRSAF
jgi:glycosyl transferase family 2